MDKRELEDILEKHSKWLAGGDDGKRANLEGANLRGANLRGANLEGANLRGANLWDANLWDANLEGANLRDANLRGACLWGANLGGACLWGANLRGVCLWGADLRGANLEGANLEGANLPPYSIVPCTGAFTAWKKLRGEHIAKLHVPENAQRVSVPTGRKCRVSEAQVVAIYTTSGEELDGTRGIESQHDSTFLYSVGATVRPLEPFDDDSRIECTSGIHCFITREEAERYQ